MDLNPPRRVRVALYIVALFVAPFAIYGQAKGWLGDPEAALISAYLVLINGLALANVSSATHTLYAQREAANRAAVQPPE